jgi:hypothetical protein
MAAHDWFDSKPMLGFRPDQLAAAFDRVRDHHDWKAPICATIPVSERTVVAAAVQWFTGTTAEFFEVPDSPGRLLVEARGQRLGPSGAPDELPRALRRTVITGQPLLAPRHRSSSRSDQGELRAEAGVE